MLVGKQGEIALLELNTIPGFTKTSLFPDAARASGIELDGLVKRLVNLAIADGTPVGKPRPMRETAAK